MRTVLFAVAASIVLSTSVGFLLWGGMERSADADRAGLERSHDELQRELRRELRALRDDQQELGSQVAAIRAELGALARSLSVRERTTAAAPSVEDVPVASSASEPAADELEDVDLEEALLTFLDPAVKESAKQELWTRIAAEGRTDDVLELFRENVEQNPRDPEAHAALGHAYIQKLLTVNDAEKWKWAMKADQSYDKALSIDDHHWDARFSKGLAYSFAPSVFGMQSKAIEQFETLRRQQEQAPVQEKKFRQTYELLGNLYENQGKSELAQQTWKRGLELFPDSEDLRTRVKTDEE